MKTTTAGALTQVKQFADGDTFISIDVYKFPLGNCGGITDSVKSIYIPAERGNYKFSELRERGELNVIFFEEQRGADYFALKPIIQPTEGTGAMSGGNLAYSSDSRCRRVYHIHDRFESWEAYNALSK